MTCTNNVCGTGIVIPGGPGDPGSPPGPGDPAGGMTLTASAVYGGIQLIWTYPSLNAHAVAHFLVYRSTTSNIGDATQIGVISGNRYFDSIAVAGTYYYWIKSVSIYGAVGNLVGPASATARDRGADTIEDIQGRIVGGVLDTALQQDIAKITLNYQDLMAEIANRVANNAALSAALADLQNGLEEAVAFVNTEITTRQEGDSALASEVTIIAAANAANAAAIIAERTARVTKEEAVANQINGIYAATVNNAAAILEEATVRTNRDSAIAEQVNTVQSTLGSQIASVQVNAETQISQVNGRVTEIGALWTARVSVNGLVGGFGIYNNGQSVQAGFDVDTFWIGRTNSDKVKPFVVDSGTVYINKARIKNADIDTLKIAGNAVTVPVTARYGNTVPGNGSSSRVAEASITLDSPGYVYAIFTANQTYGSGVKTSTTVLNIGGQSITVGGTAVTTNICVSDAVYLSAGTHTIYVDWLGQDANVNIQQRTLFVMGVKR